MLKRTIIIIILVVISTSLYFGTKMGFWVYHCKKHIQQRKNLILKETDHKELLIACQIILENTTTDTLLQESNWPLIIKNLKPTYVHVESESLDIEMGGGFFSFGIIAYKEGMEVSLEENNENAESYQYEQLIEGLWYYEEK